MHHVYILLLENGHHYIGSTQDLNKRLRKHFAGDVPTTSRIKPKELVFYAVFKSKKKTLAFEKYLKSSSGFAFRNKRLL